MLTRIEWSKLHQADLWGGSFLKLIKVTAPHFRLVRRKRRRIEPLNLAEPSLERCHIGFAGEFLHRKACRVHAPLSSSIFVSSAASRTVSSFSAFTSLDRSATGGPLASSAISTIRQPRSGSAIR